MSDLLDTLLKIALDKNDLQGSAADSEHISTPGASTSSQSQSQQELVGQLLANEYKRDLEEKLASTEAMVTNLNGCLANAQAARDVLEVQLADSEAKEAQECSRSTRLFERVTQLQIHKDTLQARLNMISNEKDVISNENADLKLQVEHLQWELQESQRKVAQLQTDVADLEWDYSRRENQFAQRAEELRVAIEASQKEDLDSCTDAVSEHQDNLAEPSSMSLADIVKIVDLGCYPVVCVLNEATNANKSFRHGIFSETKGFGKSLIEGKDSRQFSPKEFVLAQEQAEWFGTESVMPYWHCFGKAWVGIAGFANGRHQAEQASGLANALCLSALSLDPAVQKSILARFSDNYQSCFKTARDSLRAELAYVQIDVPLAISAQEARYHLLEMQSDMRKICQRRQECWLPAHLLRWSQRNCSSCFKSGASVFETARELWMAWDNKYERNRILERIPPLDIVVDSEGFLWSLDNRRLTAYKMVQALVPEAVIVRCRPSTEDEAGRSLQRKRSSLNGGLSIASGAMYHPLFQCADCLSTRIK